MITSLEGLPVSDCLSQDPLTGGVAGANLEKLELLLLRQGPSLGDSGAHTAASPANQQPKQHRPKPSVEISANKNCAFPCRSRLCPVVPAGLLTARLSASLLSFLRY